MCLLVVLCSRSRVPPANGFMTSASVGGLMGIYDYDRRARQQQPFADPPFRLDAAQNPVAGAPPVGALDVGKVRGYLHRAAATRPVANQNQPCRSLGMNRSRVVVG